IAPTGPQQSERLKPVTDPPVRRPDLSPPKLPEGGTPNFQPIPNRESQIANEVIPARMLNEFVYCPRLFYYEFVEGVFVESADTLRGAIIHQRVDTGTGGLPAAKRKADAKKSRAEVETPPPVNSPSEESDGRNAEAD